MAFFKQFFSVKKKIYIYVHALKIASVTIKCKYANEPHLHTLIQDRLQVNVSEW